ncbi:recombination regulator RecX [Clostridiaceae bacterium 35-E11]
MPEITGIEQQKKHEDRVNIYVDNEFFAGINKEILYVLRLKKGQEIEKEKLEKVIDEEMYLQAKEKALTFLKFSDRTEKEMREKLKKKEYQDHIIDKVITFLKEYKFLNDEALAKTMVISKSQYKKYGRNRIKQDLYNKGIEQSIIENTITKELDREKEYENALALAYKKQKTIKDTDPRKVYEKLGRYLSYRGYDFETIRKVLNMILKVEE